MIPDEMMMWAGAAALVLALVLLAWRAGPKRSRRDPYDEDLPNDRESVLERVGLNPKDYRDILSKKEADASFAEDIGVVLCSCPPHRPLHLSRCAECATSYCTTCRNKYCPHDRKKNRMYVED